MNTVRPSVFCSVAMRSSKSAAPIGSRPDVGSSRNKQLGIERQRAGERGALDHAAGELGGKLVGGVRRQPDERNLQHRELVGERLGERQVLAHRDLHVLLHRQPGEQRALLEHHAEALLQAHPLGRRQRVDVLAEHR